MPRLLLLLALAATSPDVPATHYLTSAQPDGIVGGAPARAVADSVERALRARGDRALPDGALAETARWYGQEKNAGLARGSGDCEPVARRYGFAGGVLAAVSANTELDRLWPETLAELPANVPVTRYGLHVASSGIATVVLGTVEVKLAPVPRRLAPGQSVRLKGELERRFARGTVLLMRPDGKVEETPVASRRIDVTLRFPKAGIYRAEVMGDGATGPLVLVNVPIYVGIPEPAPVLARHDRAPLTGAAAEARMLALLNADRARAGLRALAADAELRAIALGHGQDMARNHFVGHVSPTTGRLEDRIGRAGPRLMGAAENISLAATPDDAHEDLMSSPGHRATMLSPAYTHVGIAVVSQGDQILATLVFGKRPQPMGDWTPARALEAITALRKSRHLEPVAIDPSLRAAAEAGSAAYQRGGTKAAFAETNAALQREVDRTQKAGPPACVYTFEIVHPDQFAELPVLVNPLLRRIGLGTVVRQDAKGSWLVVVLVTEGVKCGS